MRSVPITTKVNIASAIPAQGQQHYVRKFVSDMRQVGGFLRVLPISSTNKTYLHDITEILLKMALNVLTL